MPDVIALTRAVSPRMSDCELTHLTRVPIDVVVADAQHAAYEQALADLGCTVRRVAAAPQLPDSVFIEDTAVVLDEVAIITRPGVDSRQDEPEAVAEDLAQFRPLVRIEPPGTLDGGDVLVVNKSIFVGASSRANRTAVEQLGRLVKPFGYSVYVVSIQGCLHLKSAATALPDGSLLLDPFCVSSRSFPGFRCVAIDPAESGAANVVRIDDNVLCAAAFPRTRERLERLGYALTAVDVSEIAKAEGAVTCCSLIFKKRVGA